MASSTLPPMEVPTNGNDTVGQRWAKIAYSFGFPIVAASVLMWFFMTQVNTKMDAMAVSHEAMQSELQAVKTQINGLKEQSETLKEQLWLLIGVSQATCINVAKTPQERTSCVQVSGPR